MATVLVTGGSGFIAGHCLLQLLAEGHQVRATLRSPGREAEVRDQLRRAGAPEGGRLSFAVADLTADVGWEAATAGCEFVLHVATPFPAAAPRHEDELILPAREGARRVFKAARASGVKRVVLTSSFAAIGYGHGPRATPYDESDWTDLQSPGVGAYAKSKTLAERAAWDLVAEGGPELAVVNPVVVLGPLLGPDVAPSILGFQRMMKGAAPGVPKLQFGVVDVRDVADLHLRAMTDPRAKGERFIAAAGDFMTLREIALTLRARLGDAAGRVPTRELPNWVVRIIALFDPSVKSIAPALGAVRNATSDKARRLLGWTPRPREDAIVAAAESLIRLGLV